jgi:hypothetical protein
VTTAAIGSTHDIDNGTTRMNDSPLCPDDVPPIYVSKSGYDDMGSILDRLGLPYESTRSSDVASLDDAVVMLNCKTTWLAGWLLPAYRRLARDFRSFVEQGGSGIVSDLAAGAIEEHADLSFGSGGSWTDSEDAYVEHDELAELLGRRSVTLDLKSAMKRPDELSADSTVLIREAGDGAPLGYSFSYGDGDVVHTAFHNHEQTSEVEEALLRLLLLVPIAASTGRTVTEAYTGLVATVDDIDAGRPEAATSVSNTDPPTAGDRPDTVCANCGSENSSDETFCADCGYRLEI